MRAATETVTPDAATGAGHVYRISGLKVVSDLALPGALAAADDATAPDVTVRLAEAPEALTDPEETGPTWEMNAAGFLLRTPAARFLVQEGRSIAVAPLPGREAAAAGPFVLGAAFGILLHQRGVQALHGAAVARDGAAFAICGASGLGKSTLAAALCEAGFEFVADDLCLIGRDAEGRPTAVPDGRRLKLWRESIAQLGLEGREGEAVVAEIAKYFVDPPAAAAAPPRLTAIYVLRDAHPAQAEGVEPLSLPDAMRMLDFQAYRPWLREKLTPAPTKLAQGAAVLAHARAFLLTRQRGFDRLDETVTRVREHWEGLAR